MQVGVTYPQTEIGSDLGAVKEYAQGVEAMGYTHILAFDHVLGANTASRPDWKGFYTLESQFHEPFVLFSYMAAITQRLGFATGVLILPQRQAALVAKQTATLDLLSNGRFRLGIGTGWNEVEFAALGVDFAARGKIYDEQVEILRALWTRPAVTYAGTHHRITDAGIAPLPVQRPIPIWMGGGSDRPRWNETARDHVLRRIARLADGWMPQPSDPDERSAELKAKFDGYCREYGRDPAKIGLEGRPMASRATEARWAETVEGWRRIGATHLAINTMYEGLKGPAQHLRRLEEFRKAVPNLA
jgi:probable F420-dependent oxidoreductase